jgi:hypothetical protein
MLLTPFIFYKKKHLKSIYPSSGGAPAGPIDEAWIWYPARAEKLKPVAWSRQYS